MKDTKKSSHRAYFAVDINEKAARVTKATAENNDVSIEIIQGDLLTCFDTVRLKGCLDVIMFNPPYVPLDQDDETEMEMHNRETKSIEAAWIGGQQDGMLIVNRLMPLIPPLLSRTGVFYLLLEQRNKPIQFIQSLSAFGLTGKILKTQQVRGERLSILKITHSP